MHQELVARVGKRYPVFVRLIEGGTTEKRKYWQKVFIAVALALVAKGQLEEQCLLSSNRIGLSRVIAPKSDEKTR